MQRVRDRQTGLLEKGAAEKSREGLAEAADAFALGAVVEQPHELTATVWPTLLNSIRMCDRGLVNPKKTGRQAFGHRRHRLAMNRAMKTSSRREGKL
ncbi:MAG: hypothetical protein GVY25_05945 [Bacteroidetes bacterium]|jgi:hypothetical protein|nr:hypothetical protein [Bacteroidota bacterium]